MLLSLRVPLEFATVETLDLRIRVVVVEAIATSGCMDFVIRYVVKHAVASKAVKKMERMTSHAVKSGAKGR